LLIQSDDYGFTHGVTDGCIHAIKNGIVRNTGIFINMDCAGYAVERIKEVDVCLGIDINLLAGRPVSDPKLIPHLVNEDGYFRSSRQLLQENKLVGMEKYLSIFEEDPFVYEETLLETENQVKKFIEMVGKVPEYINGHSVITKNSEDAALEIKNKYGIPGRSSDLYFGPQYVDLAYDGDEYKPSSMEEQIKMDYTDFLLNTALPSLKDGDVAFFAGHCGFIDKELFQYTSLTIQRMNDTSTACDPRVRKVIEENDIQLITYRDLL